jgi:hypothetical protein
LPIGCSRIEFLDAGVEAFVFTFAEDSAAVWQCGSAAVVIVRWVASRARCRATRRNYLPHRGDHLGRNLGRNA